MRGAPSTTCTNRARSRPAIRRHERRDVAATASQSRPRCAADERSGAAQGRATKRARRPPAIAQGGAWQRASSGGVARQFAHIVSPGRAACEFMARTSRCRARTIAHGGNLRCITDSACKNQLVVVSVQYGPFNPYIPIRSTTIGKSRVAIDPIAMHTSWRSNSDIASVTSIGYSRMSASGESSTTMHRLLHASGSHPIPPPDDPKTNQYNQNLGLIHSTNGNHLESPNEGSSIDQQVTIYLHAQNITMFPTNETWLASWASTLTMSTVLEKTTQANRFEY
ncbi:coumaroyl-CoA:anthocyanidin 3-O-glucoside-6''-O-coumaroyltransferase 1-like [Dorcoceras hygrometricum]|uniref:Coumaroyl-CoA:anthocyanidin 3-O-glucoside-6''-O-coumaroyltransferase 1-like n=1 Tax=Dorcoceras hygrometricum TaxID=472368 RepID=A0A2Z7AF37_9LAMI|nr:coumaroyl-CoA:anthocyanidin 3-O-glucoside-6''-O-coumaroyltransferase 1-like [Dorcoceras hygrometricum]